MSDSQQAAAERTDAEGAMLRLIAEKLPGLLAYWDVNQRCLFANRAYQQWFGLSPGAIVGQEARTFLGPLYPLNQPFIEGALRGELQEFEREVPDPAGGPPRQSQVQYIPDIVEGVVRGFCVLAVDITRRKEAEAALLEKERQLQRMERLAALAALAGGVAHEINNPLASVLGNLEAMLQDLEAGRTTPATLRDMLTEAREGARRVAAIVQDLRPLARTDAAKRELVDLDAAVEQGIGVAATSVRYRARLVRDLRSAGRVSCEPAQLTQVLVSLLVNAAQALPEEAAEHNELRVVTWREGAQLAVEVADNGRGLPEALQGRVFEPFFAARDGGAGAGLGLSVSSSIVQALGGQLTVHSRPGRGSAFRVLLPAAPEPAPTSPEPDRVRAPGGPARPRLLIVDDEVRLTRVLKHVLSEGCEVTALNHGREAIAALTGPGDAAFDVVLCDLMMPEVTGIDVYAEVTRLRPELARRFIFMTGGAFTPRGQQFLQEVEAPIFEKPFDAQQLLAFLQGWPG